MGRKRATAHTWSQGSREAAESRLFPARMRVAVSCVITCGQTTALPSAMSSYVIALGSRVSMSVADDGIGMRINDCHKSDNLARKTYVYSCSRLEVPSPHQRSHLPRHTRIATSVDVRAERASPGPKQDPPAHMPRVQQVVHSASRPCSVWHIHRPCFRMSELCQRTYRYTARDHSSRRS